MKKNLFLFMVICSVFIGCTKKSTPEKTLRDYVEYRFSSGQDRDDLLEMTTGALYDRLAEMEEKDLESFLEVDKLKKKRLKVLLKNCQPQECSLTYILSYSQGEGQPKDFGIEVKKIAQLIKIENSWKISDVSNVKTYIEAQKNLDVSAEGDSESP